MVTDKIPRARDGEIETGKSRFAARNVVPTSPVTAFQRRSCALGDVSRSSFPRCVPLSLLINGSIPMTPTLEANTVAACINGSVPRLYFKSDRDIPSAICSTPTNEGSSANRSSAMSEMSPIGSKRWCGVPMRWSGAVSQVWSAMSRLVALNAPFRPKHSRNSRWALNASSFKKGMLK